MNSLALVDSNLRTHYRDRWYSPEQGQFLSEDPVGFEGDDLNLYRYVENNPLVYRDSYGKNKLLLVLGACALVAYKFREPIKKIISKEIKKKFKNPFKTPFGDPHGSGGSGGEGGVCPLKNPPRKQKNRCRDYPSSPGCRQFSNCKWMN